MKMDITRGQDRERVRSIKVEKYKQIGDSEGEDEENEIIYNLKNLSLGWDGKPTSYCIDISFMI